MPTFVARSSRKSAVAISTKNVAMVNINEEHVRALLRNYECVYALVMRGARLKGGR